MTSSMAGRLALPFMSSYVASKFALEGFADTLRRELATRGVKVVVLDLGAIKTSIFGKSTAKEDPVYTEVKKFADLFSAEGVKHAYPSESVAKLVEEVLRIKNPKTRYIFGGNVGMAKILLYLPDKWVDFLISQMLKKMSNS